MLCVLMVEGMSVVVNIMLSLMSEMCMCLARGGVGCEWIRGLGLGFTNHVATGGVLDVYMCLNCGGVCREWVGGLDQGLEGWVVLCVCEL